MIHSVAPRADHPSTPIRESEPAESAVRQTRAAKTNHASSEEAQSDPSDLAAITRAATKVGEVLDSMDSRLKIKVDDETGRVVVKVVQQDSDKVIRQIPPEELLQLERYLASLKGMLLQEQA